MNYVKTQFGNIHINDIPLVVPESTNSKFRSSFIFFSIFIIATIIFLYVIEWAPNPHKKERIVIEGFTNKILTTVKASSIDVYSDELYLENIVLITADNNVINIDVLKDKYVTMTKNGDDTIYSLDFKAELKIKEIILISDDDPDKYIKHVNIDLHNRMQVRDDLGSKVWEYSAFLPNLRENSILISKQVFKATDWADDTLGSADDTTKKIIMNETQLALTLTESDETYSSY